MNYASVLTDRFGSLEDSPLAAVCLLLKAEDGPDTLEVVAHDWLSSMTHCQHRV